MNFLITIFLWTTGAIAANDPETKIEISLFDLVPTEKKPNPVHSAFKSKLKSTEPQLPKDYAKEVARIIRENVPKIKKCNTGDEAVIVPNDLNIQIANSGSASIALPPSVPTNVASTFKFDTCIRSVVSNLHFPKHVLKETVNVKIPIQWKKEEI